MLKKLIIICLLGFAVSGCGFHLRGHFPLPPQLHYLYLQTNNPYTPLSKDLRRALLTTGIRLATYPNAAPVTLNIISDTFGQSITSIGSSQQVTTYFLTYTVIYQLTDASGHVLLCPQTIITNRTYSIASNQILADTTTLTTLQIEMRRDAIFQMLNRLRSPLVAHVLQQVC